MVRLVGYAYDHGPLLDTFPVIFFVAGTVAAWRAGRSRTTLLVPLNCAGAAVALLLAYMDLPKP